MEHRESIRRRSTVTATLAAGIALLVAAAAPLPAQESPTATELLVRVVANDAKVIGSGVGGARVTVRDAGTGEVLAEGIQEGTTGSTDRIVRQPRTRGEAIYDTDGTADFVASLELRRPTVVEVRAEGPLDYPHATRSASKTLLVVPGQDLTGDGLVLRLHGFVVEVLDPEPGTAVEAGQRVEVEAHVQMMCGCPTEPGGLWDSDRYTLTARLVSEGRIVAETPMGFAGRTSHFEADLRVPDGDEALDDLQVEVEVADAERVNFGLDRVPLEVGRDL